MIIIFIELCSNIILGSKDNTYGQEVQIITNQKIEDDFNNTKLILKNVDNDKAEEYSNWVYEKAKLKFGLNSNPIVVKKGFIYWAKMGDNIGSEQNKERPVLIITTYPNSDIITVVPLSTKVKKIGLNYHIKINSIKSIILLEQIRTISVARIHREFKRKGKLVQINNNTIKNINKQIDILFKL